MNDSCCICGLILATQDSNFPEWCKTIRALCLVEYEPLLSGLGYVDNDAMPYKIEIPYRGSQRFCFGRAPTEMFEAGDFCYPFHAACWILLEEIDIDKLFDNHIGALYNIFESFHYDKKARSLKWGHNFYIEEILGLQTTEESQGDDILTANKANHTILVDPLRFTFSKDPVPVFSLLKTGLNFLGYINDWFRRQISAALAIKGSGSTASPIYSRAGVELLPLEILESILYCLEFCDVQHLLQASPVLYRRYARDPNNLPSSFWESRFWVHGEAAFTRSLCPLSCSLKDWFFTTKSELRNGPNKMNLQNRRRIWKLGVELITLVRAVAAPGRTLYGNTIKSQPDQGWGPAASCVAAEHDSNGCRLLRQVYVPFDIELSRHGLCGVIAYFVVISGRRIISGLTFKFGNVKCVNAGYISDKHENLFESALGSNSISLTSTRLGFEAIKLTGSPPPPDLETSGRYQLAVNQWQWKESEGVYLGLDAMRIVSICIKGFKQDGLGDIAWTPPLPLSAPFIESSDAIALNNLQMASFAPASTINIQLEKGQLIAVKVYSALGGSAGIAGLQFVYDKCYCSNWGFTDDTAVLTFFLSPIERIVKVTVYTRDSIVYHLQFTTNFNRKSQLLPQLIEEFDGVLQSVEYKVLENGYITGFCGCFVESSQQLKCFGVIATSTLASHKSTWIPTINDYTPISYSQVPIGGIQNHGQHVSYISLRENYISIEASINPSTSKYRQCGQVTGLLFRPVHDTNHPDLLGQWTGPSTTYVLDDDEKVMDLEVVTVSPRIKQRSRSGLSQVKSVTVLTNRRRISWGLESQCIQTQQSSSQRSATAVFWEFNAIFDRVRCIYMEE